MLLITFPASFLYCSYIAEVGSDIIIIENSGKSSTGYLQTSLQMIGELHRHHGLRLAPGQASLAVVVGGDVTAPIHTIQRGYLTLKNVLSLIH